MKRWWGGEGSRSGGVRGGGFRGSRGSRAHNGFRDVGDLGVWGYVRFNLSMLLENVK